WNWKLARDIGPAAFMVLYALLDYTKEADEWRCNPGRKALSEKTGLNLKTIQRALNTLYSFGLVSRYKTPRGNVYQIHSVKDALASRKLPFDDDSVQTPKTGLHSGNVQTPKTGQHQGQKRVCTRDKNGSAKEQDQRTRPNKQDPHSANARKHPPSKDDNGRYLYPPQFDEWWETYPAREQAKAGKLQAHKAWCNLDPTEYADLAKATAQLAKATDYPPNGATFLNSDWRSDYLDAPAKVSSIHGNEKPDFILPIT
ncbi:MAG: helix-turn-helix domain-containing protein, partial [Planctomycetota bacterium]|nr:helix-turn-helix domain-containing protein [Planctomycetota bacterium]